ncbi:MAG: putative enzyme related to lactoylglutathione lyase [Myxococcota bacterium]|jgi:predicted enzyme related to lactoylglutathione lyase
MRFSHILSINLFVESDFAPLRRFYEEGLDLPYLRDKGGVLAFYPGETALNLVQADGDTASFVGRSTGLCLRARAEGNLARVIDRMRKKGTVVADRDFSQFRGGHRLHVADPHGNRFTLWEAPEDSPELDTPNMYDGPSSVTVAVRDIRRALGFFTTVLELPMLDQPDPWTARFFPDGTQLIVAQKPSWTPAEPVSGETGICLHVDDPHSMVDNLRGRGASFDEEPVEVNGVLMASFHDPDGNRFTMAGRV